MSWQPASARSAESSALPGRRGLVVATAVWGALVLVPISDTGIGLSVGLLVLVGTALLGTAWLVALVVVGSSRRGRRLGWVAVPSVVVAIAVIVLGSPSTWNPLFRARFALSRSALQTMAVGPAASPDTSAPHWVGLFRVQRVDRLTEGVRVITASCGLVDECGLAYIPGPPPPKRGKLRLTPLGGGWYHLYSVF